METWRMERTASDVMAFREESLTQMPGCHGRGVRKFHDARHLSPRLAGKALAVLRGLHESSVCGECDGLTRGTPRRP